MINQKKANARVEKWRTMLSEGLHKDEALLKSRVRKGIPSSMRMIAWCALVKLDQFKEKNKEKWNYERLCNKFSNSVSDITLDIPRTFPQEQDSKVLQKSMNNVLKAISIVCPPVGYCQGMNFLTHRLLQVLSDEDSFWLLFYLIETDESLRNNLIAPQSVELNNYVFEKILQEENPTLFQYFQANQIQFRAFTMKWFISIYSGTFHQDLFNRYFEVYLLQGWPIIYQVGLALLKSHQNLLKKSSMEECMYIMGKELQQIKDIDEFMNLVYAQSNITAKVKALEEEYFVKIQEHGRKHYSEILLSRVNPKNEAIKKFAPQRESITNIIFKNKEEQVNFDALYMLKKIE